MGFTNGESFKDRLRLIVSAIGGFGDRLIAGFYSGCDKQPPKLGTGADQAKG